MKPSVQWVAFRWRCPIDGAERIVLARSRAWGKYGIAVDAHMPARSWHHYLAHRRILAPAVTEQYRARQIARRRRRRRA